MTAKQMDDSNTRSDLWKDLDLKKYMKEKYTAERKSCLIDLFMASEGNWEKKEYDKKIAKIEAKRSTSREL